MKKIVICLIATRRYKQFVTPLVESIKKYFLLRHSIEVVVFTDDIHAIDCQGNDRVTIMKDLIVSYGWPEATIRRYEIMTSRTYNCDYIYYLDVDYLIASEIDEEIFGNIVAVRHPGFYSGVNGPGTWCEDRASNAYTFPENRKHYYCGGTQGGAYEYYYRAMKRLAWEIRDDERRGVKAEHNDEAHWNRYLSELNQYKVLNPGYCVVEQKNLRKLWGIDTLPVKIIALDKDHKSMRE